MGDRFLIPVIHLAPLCAFECDRRFDLPPGVQNGDAPPNRSAETLIGRIDVLKLTRHAVHGCLVWP
jgi:hypothetical protein